MMGYFAGMFNMEEVLAMLGNSETLLMIAGCIKDVRRITV
jgi:hypothetical protein